MNSDFNWDWKYKASCLDAAYERIAVEQGLNTSPVFPENQIIPENFLTLPSFMEE